MDSFLFIGWRIDCEKPRENSGYHGNYKQYKQIVDNPPINKGEPRWSYWTKPPHHTDTFLFGPGSYYKCPFGHYTLWEDLDKCTFDYPSHFLNEEIKLIQELTQDPLWKLLHKDYKVVYIRWGILKGLG